MRVDSILQKLEVYVVMAVAAVLVSGFTFLLSSPFSAEQYGLTDASTTTPQDSARTSSAAAYESPPALLEPALRSLDGVAYHG